MLVANKMILIAVLVLMNIAISFGMITAAPSVSMAPSMSVSPSSSPSVSSQPSMSSQPSLEPTISSVPSPAPSSLPTTECYTNTTILHNDMLNRGATDSKTRTYILCPNTVFQIGTVTIGGVEGGDFPLTFRSNTIVQCGEDGAVENNCILTGGNHLIEFSAGNIFDFFAENVIVRGLILENAISNAIIIGRKGDLLLEDCIIRNMSPLTPVYSIYNGFSLFPTPGPDEVDVTMRRVLFENLSQGAFSDALGFGYGIIRVVEPDRNRFTLEDCVFRNNYYPGIEGKGDEGYAIRNFGSAVSITLKNNCFYNNTFTSWGPIQAFDGVEITTDMDYSEELPEGSTVCNFIAKSDKRIPDLLADVTCVEATAEICGVEKYPPPNEGDDDDDDDDASAATLASVSYMWISTALMVAVAPYVMAL